MKSNDICINNNRITLSIREIALYGMMIAALEGAKSALAFIPNVELVSLFIILFTLVIGRKVFFVILSFVLIECIIWGNGLWSLMYMYVWPLLALCTLLVKKYDSFIIYSGLSGMFGMLFGALCSLPYFFIGGPSMAFSWWIAGIPWDIVHGFSNFIICMVMFNPLYKVIKKQTKYFI